MHAPIIVALIAGLVVGALCQRSRMCMVAGIRDLVLFKDWKLLLGFVTIIIAALIGNLVTGNFHLGFTGQPVAHAMHLWNFMGMLVLSCWAAALCVSSSSPVRATQTPLSPFWVTSSALLSHTTSVLPELLQVLKAQAVHPSQARLLSSSVWQSCWWLLP